MLITVVHYKIYSEEVRVNMKAGSLQIGRRTLWALTSYRTNRFCFVAFNLPLLEQSFIHPVYHVSHLKKVGCGVIGGGSIVTY